MGAGRGPAPAMSDPIATRVMSRGAAIATPVGRADDFSWPRAEAKEPAPTQVEVVPPAPSPTPAAPPATSAKDAAGKNAVKKPSDAKKEFRAQCRACRAAPFASGARRRIATAVASRCECALI